jgi:hypothetical protein
VEQITNLRTSVVQLTEETAKLRRAFARRTVAIVVLSVALAIAVLVMARVQADNDRRIRENNQRWCPLVSLLVPRPGDPPSTTARGRQIAERAVDLSQLFSCPQIGA